MVENQIPNLHVAPGRVVWNDEDSEQHRREWEHLLCGVSVPYDYHDRLVNDILEDPSAELLKVNCY